MTWRSLLAVLVALVGVLGPCAVVALVYGVNATLKDVRTEDPRMYVLLAVLLVGSTACALASAALIRSESLHALRAQLEVHLRGARRHRHVL